MELADFDGFVVADVMRALEDACGLVGLPIAATDALADKLDDMLALHHTDAIYHVEPS